MTLEEIKTLKCGDRLLWMGEGSGGGWVLDNGESGVLIGWDGGIRKRAGYPDGDAYPSSYWVQITRGTPEDDT